MLFDIIYKRNRIKRFDYLYVKIKHNINTICYNIPTQRVINIIITGTLICSVSISVGQCHPRSTTINYINIYLLYIYSIPIQKIIIYVLGFQNSFIFISLKKKKTIINNVYVYFHKLVMRAYS